MSPPDPHLDERRRMVEEQIHARGVTDPRVLDAMVEIPRELFVATPSPADAFTDRALPIDCQQTISQPYMVAVMTALLDLQPQHCVLEVGTGSGYQTAILARLARQVFTVERWPELLESAHRRLDALALHNIEYRLGDGSAGWPEAAPFDRIMVTAGASDIPATLTAQLTDTGRLVIPVGGQPDQILTVLDRNGSRFIEHPQFPCRFVPLIGEYAGVRQQTQA